MTTKAAGNQLTLAEAQLEAALAERPCPGCNRIGCPRYTPDYPKGGADCFGTGRVPLLPGLRRACPACEDQECSVHVGGDGWVPETDGWKAMGPLYQAGHDVAFRAAVDAIWGALYSNQDHELAFWRAVVAWCRAQEEAK